MSLAAVILSLSLGCVGFPDRGSFGDFDPWPSDSKLHLRGFFWVSPSLVGDGRFYSGFKLSVSEGRELEVGGGTTADAAFCLANSLVASPVANLSVARYSLLVSSAQQKGIKTEKT